LAKRENGGAGRVRNSERINQVFLTIEQRVKRQIVQDAVRNDDEVARAEARAQRSHQFLVQVAQMRLCRVHQ
jgi:hypothetical protein